MAERGNGLVKHGKKLVNVGMVVGSSLVGGAAGGQSVSWWQQQYQAVQQNQYQELRSEVSELRSSLNQRQGTQGESVAAVNATVKMAVDDLREIRREFREAMRGRR